MSGLAVLTLCVAVIVLVLLGLRRGARKHRAMYAEISARCADIQARAAQRAVIYDQTPVSPPPRDGTATAGAGAPDAAPVVAPPPRTRLVLGGSGRHRKAAA